METLKPGTKIRIKQLSDYKESSSEGYYVNAEMKRLSGKTATITGLKEKYSGICTRTYIINIGPSKFGWDIDWFEVIADNSTEYED